MRKERDLDVEDYIESFVVVDNEEVMSLLRSQDGYISDETRSKVLEISTAERRRGYSKKWLIEGNRFIITIARMQ